MISTPKLLIEYKGIKTECQLSGKQTLGRASREGKPDIDIDNKIVSRHHGLFITNEEGSWYRDEENTYGTFYNGKKLEKKSPIFLKDGDILLIHALEDTEGSSDVTLVYSLEAPQTKEKPVSKPRSIAVSDKVLSIDIRERNVFVKNKKKTLLKDIRLDIPAGSMTLVLGGSGAGKTTFLNAVMGYEEADGTIIYDGVDIYEEYEQMKYEIGYVPQQDLMRPSDIVFETVLNAAQLRLPSGLSQDVYVKKAEEVLKLLGLSDEKNQLVKSLSGGQRKRLSIAMEYVGNPSLFFLDEPDSGVDNTNSELLLHQLRTIADEGKIVMFISHSPDRAFDLLDKVIVLAKNSMTNSGQLVFYGSPQESLRFFGVDSLNKIVSKINKKNEGGEGLADFFIEKYMKEGHLYG